MLKKISFLLLVCVYLSSCSGTRVQTNRLNNVEGLVYQAENVLKAKSSSNYKQIARENLESAGAYLLTLRDNKSTFTADESKRYQYLLQRVSSLNSAIK